MSAMNPQEVSNLAAKVLLLEHDTHQYQTLFDFCEAQGLIAVPRTAQDGLAALAEHKDLAGVLLAEDLPCEVGDALNMARVIHRLRPELPIFLRRTTDFPLVGDTAAAVSHPYETNDLQGLQAHIGRSLFNVDYPQALIDGIIDLTCEAMRSMFPNSVVRAEPPYVVHDRIIHGQVSTLIPLESTWCRGYMMLQTEESALRQGIVQGLGYEGVGGDLGFRELNHLLGETTNLIWGAFKNRYIPPEAFATLQTQVPIVINHEQKYISFGSPDPQLCIRYQMSDPRRPRQPPLLIVQRLIFNLWWSAEEFARFNAKNAEAPSTGELELF